MNNTKKDMLILLLVILGLCACSPKFSQPHAHSVLRPQAEHRYMTNQDVYRVEDSNSLVRVTNSQGSAVNTFGLFISQIWSGDACSGSALYASTTTAGGGFFKQTNFSGNESVSIGSNFLYNMVSNALFYGAYTDSPSTSLYPGINNSGGNTWCIYIGVFGDNTCHQGESCAPHNLVVVNAQTVIAVTILCDDSTQSCSAKTGSPNQLF